MIKIGDNVRVPLGLGIVIDIRNVVGTKHQTNRYNKIDYLVKINDDKLPKNYVDWFEDYNVDITRKLRVDEAFNLYGKIKRVKKVGIYNDITHFKDDYYLFYDEDEVYHLENKKTGKVVYTFSANGQQQAWVKALAYITKEL